MDPRLPELDSKNLEDRYDTGEDSCSRLALKTFSDSVFKKNEEIVGDETQRASLVKQKEIERDFQNYADSEVNDEDPLKFFKSEIKKYTEHPEKEFYFQDLKSQKIYVLFKNAREEKTRLENIIMHLDHA